MVKKTIDVEVNAGNSVDVIKKVDNAMIGLGDTVDDVNNGLGKMKPTAKGVNDALKNGGKSAGKFSQVMGQAGFQVQDFIVQVQGGTSALTAFTQQAPQLAGAFGPGGAVVGAFLAMAGVLGGVLFSSLSDTKTSFEKLQLAADNLKNVMSIGESGIVTYSDEMRELAKISERTARLGLAVAINEQKEGLEAAKRAAFDLRKGLFDAIGPIDRTLTEVTELMTGVAAGSKGFREAGANVFMFIQELKNIQKNGASVESLNNLEDILSKIEPTTKKSTKEFIAIQKKVFELSSGARSAQQGIDALKSTLSQTSVVTGEYGTENQALFDGYEEFISMLDDYNASEAEQLRIKKELVKSTRAQIETVKAQTQAMINETLIREKINAGLLSQEEGRNQLELQRISDYYSMRRMAILDNEKLTDQQRQELLNSLHEQEVAAQKLRQEQLTAINKKGADDRNKVSDAEAKANRDILINTAVSAFNLTRSSNQKMTKEQKKQARQSVIINTAAAIARAYGENNFYVASGMAVFLAGMQLQQINKIKSADGGGSVGGGGSFSAVSPDSPPIPTQNTQQLGGFEVRGLEELRDSISSDRLYSGDVVAKLLESIEQFRNLGGGE